MTEQLLASLHADKTALTPIFQANIDEAMLREIANADYGEGAEECHALLQQFLRTGLVESDDFQLREVLELTRWAPGPGRHGDWERLFACTALLQLSSRFPERFEGECETLAPLVLHAIELGEPVAQASASMLAWRFLAYPGNEEDRPFLAFAILLLAVHLEGPEGRGPWLKQLAEWVMEEESHAWRERAGPGTEWLLGLTHFRQHEGLWHFLAQHVLMSPDRHPTEADESLRLIGGQIAAVWSVGFRRIGDDA
jgi:hypothetical protein